MSQPYDQRMAMWLIERRKSEHDEWQLVTGVYEAVMARAAQEELEEEGFLVRARERGDLPPDERAEFDRQLDAREYDFDLWERYGIRAAARLKREELTG
jgi:hypothetical protein